MSRRAAITIHRSREEVERLWRHGDHAPEQLADGDASVRFADAPGDRGTEVHVELARQPQGPAGKVVETVAGSAALARVKDQLRHFKQLVETGEIARSESVPDGEHAGRKLKQRPAQPLAEPELEKAGA
jgi:hypothetical protein